MSSPASSQRSLWFGSTPVARYPRLEADLEVDVVVVGGGITGVTTALLLQQAGKRVALVEQSTLCAGVTGSSTAHVTEVVDARYRELERSFDPQAAALVRQSSRAAIEQLASLAATLPEGCGWQSVPGFLCASSDQDTELLEEELEAASRAGARVHLAPAPFPLLGRPALKFENQAQLDPVSYVRQLAQAAEQQGCSLFERSLVVNVEDGERMEVVTEHGPKVRAEWVINATHAPSTTPTFQAKLAQYRSYVVAGRIEAPIGALLWDTEDPYHYIRSATIDGTSYAIVGGADHKTGKAARGEHAHFEELEALCSRIGVVPSRRWSAQVVEPADGLPFIGESPMMRRQLIATGFAGNGVTFGTLSAMMFRDQVLGRPNLYAELYRPSRFKPVASLGPLLKENVDFPMQMAADRLQRTEASTLDAVGPGEGRIVRLGGEKLAVYREPGGTLHAVSAICTHMGCQVKFNASERSWDCPCHGSRFDVTGAVLDGPAMKPLSAHALGEADAERKRAG